MSTENLVNWDAALADIEARIAKLQGIADGIREMIAQSSTAPGPGGSGGVRPGAFLKMSIPDATKKHLEAVHQKQTTREIMDAMEKGGLPPSKYNTVYSILRRREREVGDVVNMNGDWGLKEWYPNYRPKSAKANGADKKDAPVAETVTDDAKASA